MDFDNAMMIWTLFSGPVLMFLAIMYLSKEARNKVILKIVYPIKRLFMLNPERGYYKVMLTTYDEDKLEEATEAYMKAKARRKFIREHREFRKVPHEWVETLLPDSEAK